MTARITVRLYTPIMQDWNTEFIRQSPLFEPLRKHDALCVLWRARHWPSLPELQALIEVLGTVSGGGQRLRLVSPEARGGAFEDHYEARIYRAGELQMRPHNRHDLFNLLVWMTFPRTKAAINARHYQALLDRDGGTTLNRGPAQDTLTLFDESGIVVVASDPALLQDVRDFAWKRLFWQQRYKVQQQMRWFLFGHALYEKALRPYVGMSGQGVLLTAGSEFHAWKPARQVAFVDEVVARRVSDKTLFCATNELAPIPALGVPGWWPQNETESFYDNQEYFRPGRRANRLTSR